MYRYNIVYHYNPYCRHASVLIFSCDNNVPTIDFTFCHWRKWERGTVLGGLGEFILKSPQHKS